MAGVLSELHLAEHRLDDSPCGPGVSRPCRPLSEGVFAITLLAVAFFGMRPFGAA